MREASEKRSRAALRRSRPEPESSASSQLGSQLSSSASGASSLVMPEPWLVDSVRQRASAFSDQLRSLQSTAVGVPNLDWTVRELAQHVAGLPHFWSDRHADGDEFALPEDFEAWTAAYRDHIAETSPIELADRVDTEFARFLDEMQSSEPQRWLYGLPTTPRNMCGLALNELIQHGHDLAGVTGAKAPDYERREANVAVAAMMALTPAFVDEQKARALPDGTYHVRFRDGDDYTWSKRGGALTIVAGKPARADARMAADPAMFLWSSLGRVSDVRAALSGKMRVYGRKPWRFLGLGNIAIDGV